MPLGFRAAARTQRTTRPVMQVPAVVAPPIDVDPPPIGGQGGGTAPTAPSDITVGVPANKWVGWGGNTTVNDFASLLTQWDTDLGMHGLSGTMSGEEHIKVPLENGQYFTFSGAVTNVIDPLNQGNDSHNDWFQAYMGYGVPVINGHAYGTVATGGGGQFGPFVYKRTHPTYSAWIGLYMRLADTYPSPPLGNWFDDTNWTGIARTLSNYAAGVKFMGGAGLTFDNESSERFNVWTQIPGGSTNITSTVRPSSPAAGMAILESDTGNYRYWNGTAWQLSSLSELTTKVEARGFQVGQAIYGAFPNCSVLIYEWRISGGAYDSLNHGASYPRAASLQDSYYWGMMRAAAAANSQGYWWIWDQTYYRQPQNFIATAQRTNQNACAILSQRLPAATRDQVMPRFGIIFASWANTDGSSFPGNAAEPAYSQQQANYRNYSMFGWRSEYLYGQVGINGPGATTGSPAQSIYYDSRTNPPGGHQPGFATAAASATTTPHPSSTPPTLSASVSGTGTTRTITGSAAHLYGIHWVRAYIYPSGTPVYAVMTLNEGGGSVTTNFNNAFMSYTINLTGVTGGYAIVQTESTMGHQHSMTVSIGGGGGTIPFRLFSDTSLWNTTKTGLTFDADADSTLSTLTYGVNNGAFCHPFFRGVSTDPTWTVTATEDHWGKPPRTVTFKAPTPMSHATGSDGVLTVLDSTTNILWDMYAVAAIDNTAHTITTPMLVDSDGIGSGFGNQSTFASVGTAAIGIAQASGTILATDVNNGIIPHGLFMAFDYNNEGGVNTSGTDQVAPAVAWDNGGAPGPIPQGGLMVAQGSEPAGLNAMEHQLWLACTTYGVYCCDRLSGHPQFYGDGSTLVDNAFTDAGLTAIGRKLRLVRTSW